MFFLLSKILLFLLRPLVWVVGLLLLSRWLRRERARRISFWTAMALLWIFGNNFLVNQVVKAYEYGPVRLEGRYDLAVVLGGYLAVPPDTSLEVFELSESADRLFLPYALYRSDRVEQLLLSGGSPSFLDQVPPEAAVVADYLKRAGVPAADILLDTAARNTFENAQFTAELLKERQLSPARVLLVTSAWHMPRARACFRRAGLEVIPYPVDFMQSFATPTPADVLLPSVEALRNWERLLKEWVGLAVYRMRGWA